MADETTQEIALRPMPALDAGAEIAPIIPRTLEEIGRLATWIMQAAMVPASYTVEAKDCAGDPKKAAEATRARLMIGIEKGLEIGMGPVTALSTIMIVNNRPCIWGDGAVALAQRTKQVAFVEQVFEGEEGVASKDTISPADFPDSFTAVFRIARKGQEKTYEGRFSVRDAKRAHLWMNPKKEPWINYPKRMLMARARAFALREAFADALMGLGIVEEVQDIPAPPPERTNTDFLADAPRSIEHKPQATFQAPLPSGEAVPLSDVRVGA